MCSKTHLCFKSMGAFTMRRMQNALPCAIWALKTVQKLKCATTDTSHSQWCHAVSVLAMVSFHKQARLLLAATAHFNQALALWCALGFCVTICHL